MGFCQSSLRTYGYASLFVSLYRFRASDPAQSRHLYLQHIILKANRTLLTVTILDFTINAFVRSVLAKKEALISYFVFDLEKVL